MAKIIWSPKAINELGRICDYIGENSEYYARLFVENVFKRTHRKVFKVRDLNKIKSPLDK